MDRHFSRSLDLIVHIGSQSQIFLSQVPKSKKIGLLSFLALKQERAPVHRSIASGGNLATQKGRFPFSSYRLALSRNRGLN